MNSPRWRRPSSRRSNVAYAARFLKRLHEETSSWARATAHYHSRDPDRGQAYRDKVFRLWDGLLDRHVVARPAIRLAGAPPAAARAAGAGKRRRV